jgi:allophanate hydrolase
MEGDIQITGDGTPYVLMAESQTTGGYPRIAQVLPCDLPRLAQLSSGAEVMFQMISHGEAVEIERAAQAARAQLGAMCKPVLRDPREAGDLLAMQLISGVTAGEDEG